MSPVPVAYVVRLGRRARLARFAAHKGHRGSVARA